MKKIILIWMLLVISAGSWADEFEDSERLFEFAEREYPEFFSPPGMETERFNEYWLRYYPNTDIYLGALGNSVYVYGAIFNGLLKVGEISDFIFIGTDDDLILKDAFENQLSGIQVGGGGRVIRLLADDLVGSRHQRFIIQLNSGQTLLISHNIDLAPRINNLKINDSIEFYGEYVWNEKGGLIHWTHYDPKGIHPDGWLLHQNVYY